MAKMRLRHLGRHVPMELTLDVFCQRTCRVVGQLAVLVAPIARSKERRRSTNNGATSSGLPMDPQPLADEDEEEEELRIGQHLVFEIRIGALSGIDEAEFTHVHTQYQLDLFDSNTSNKGTFGDNEHAVYVTPCASKFNKHSRIDFDYTQTFSRVVSAEMLDAIQHGELIFEVYGQPQPLYLKSFQDEPCASHQLPSVEKKHNVYAWVEVCELARVSGEYTPVQVLKPANARVGSRLDEDDDDDDVDEGFMATMTTGTPLASSTTRSLLSKMASHDHHQPKGTFLLRQGHQRRIVLTICHDWILPTPEGGDNDGLTIDGVDGLVLWLGDIRDRSSTNTPPAQAASIPLSVVSRTVDTLVLEGAWDSSLHNSLLLNRVTDADQTVVMTIKWIFHGAPFQMDVGVQITSGDAGTNAMGLFKRQSLLRNLFSSSSTTTTTTSDDDDMVNGDDTDGDYSRAIRSGRRHGKKKSSIAGIYRVWERSRRLSSYHVHHQVNSEHYEWQQHQMEKIKTYDLARQSMLTKLDVAHTRYTLALLDALQKRRRRPVPTLATHSPEKYTSLALPLLHSIIRQWMHSAREERTGLQLVKAFGSTDQLEASTHHSDIPLYDVHQIYLR
jgi:kinesin family protein 1